ncbi:Panacea domain-containing protein [uncultured Psychrobacter sp.]|uniref:Panacea domain-containing protein n=1 Tax=uncultured Psychrobacter sp. TaxID=259303 RepID=UPI003458A131
MNILNALIRYICLVYPYPQELSNARLTKLIYLTDWESVRLYDYQVTSINWYFDNYGPFVNDVYETAKKDPYIDVISTYTMYGTPKTLFRYIGENLDLNLNDKTKILVDEVIKVTQSMYWNEFIEYVYSTPPIVNSNRYSFLDLLNFRESYIN